MLKVPNLFDACLLRSKAAVQVQIIRLPIVPAHRQVSLAAVTHLLLAAPLHSQHTNHELGAYLKAALRGQQKVHVICILLIVC